MELFYLVRHPKASALLLLGILGVVWISGVNQDWGNKEFREVLAAAKAQESESRVRCLASLQGAAGALAQAGGAKTEPAGTGPIPQGALALVAEPNGGVRLAGSSEGWILGLAEAGAIVLGERTCQYPRAAAGRNLTQEIGRWERLVAKVDERYMGSGERRGGRPGGYKWTHASAILREAMENARMDWPQPSAVALIDWSHAPAPPVTTCSLRLNFFSLDGGWLGVQEGSHQLECRSWVAQKKCDRLCLARAGEGLGGGSNARHLVK